MGRALTPQIFPAPLLPDGQQQDRESLALEEALALLLRHAQSVDESEETPLFDANGRVCYADIHSVLPQPPYDRVQVDGFAMRSRDIVKACPERPIMLPVMQHCYAGDAPGMPVAPGQAARVTTGAVLPPGTDCVVWQEDTQNDSQTVLVFRPLSAGRNVRPRGGEMPGGHLLAKRGDLLHSGTLSLLAGQGYTHVRTFRRLNVALLATGSELALPGAPLPQGCVYNVSSTLLGIRLRHMGANLTRTETCGDNSERLRDILEEMLAVNDLVITTGGVSTGPKDLMPGITASLAAEHGGTVLFQSLRIKPGSMTLAGALPGKLIMGLSGNPVAAAATFGLLVVPVLKKISGASRFGHERQRAVVQNDFGACRKDARRMVMARLAGKNVFLSQDGRQAGGGTASAPLCDEFNCFVDIPPGTPPLRKGMEVDVILA